MTTDTTVQALRATLTITDTPHNGKDLIRLTIATTDGLMMAFLTHQEARRLAYSILARADPYQTDQNTPESKLGARQGSGKP